MGSWNIYPANNISGLNEAKWETQKINLKQTTMHALTKGKNITSYKKNVLVSMCMYVTSMCDRVQRSTEDQWSKCALSAAFLSTWDYIWKPGLKRPKTDWMTVSLLKKHPLVLAQSSGVTHKLKNYSSSSVRQIYSWIKFATPLWEHNL